MGNEQDIGAQLREWRQWRRLTQLELALDADVSTRHLSFVETGRSRPGRAMLLRVLRRLDVPVREQNVLLVAAGHAPAAAERSLDDPELTPFREALDSVLARHEPYPAVAFDRGWDLIAANKPLESLAFGTEIDRSLLEPPINVLRIGLHPRGLAPMIANYGEWRAHFRARLKRQLATTGDPALEALLAEIAAYPAPGEEGEPSDEPPGEILAPLKLHAPGGGELSFVGMFASFDTPFEVTSSEIAIELLFPADRDTGEALAELHVRH